MDHHKKHPANQYADGEMVHFPLHWDEQTRQLVRFMIFEAYKSGNNVGFSRGQVLGIERSIGLLHDFAETTRNREKGWIFDEEKT